MFDPESPKQPPILSRNAKPNLSPYLLAISMPEKDRLRFYLMNCKGTRAYFGFGITHVKNPEGEVIGRKLTVENREKLSHFDSETRSLLWELYNELK